LRASLGIIAVSSLPPPLRRTEPREDVEGATNLCGQRVEDAEARLRSVPQPHMREWRRAIKRIDKIHLG